MFMKRGGANPGPPAPPTATSPTPGVQPNQIPYVNPPLPSGPAASNGEEEVTEERVLADPTWAENLLHASLTVRSIKWLELLKQDETLNPQPGQRLVTLDTQVQMFKVISDWLKTSKKTKEAGDDESVPGIELMRQVIREEMALVKPTPKPKPPSDDEDDGDPPRRKVGGFAKGNKAAGAKPPEDDRQLSAMVNRAREAAYKED